VTVIEEFQAEDTNVVVVEKLNDFKNQIIAEMKLWKKSHHLTENKPVYDLFERAQYVKRNAKPENYGALFRNLLQNEFEMTDDDPFRLQCLIDFHKELFDHAKSKNSGKYFHLNKDTPDKLFLMDGDKPTPINEVRFFEMFEWLDQAEMEKRKVTENAA